LERAGWRFGDAAEFLEMSGEERRQLDENVAARCHPATKSPDGRVDKLAENQANEQAS
jgi:hypothetical protein